MSECLKPETLMRYRRGSIESLDELQTIDAHLASCRICRETLNASIAEAGPSLAMKITPSPGDSTCLEDAVIARYVDGQTDANDAEIVESHIAECARCAEDIASLRAFRTQMQTYDWTRAKAAVEPKTFLTSLRDWFLDSRKRWMTISAVGAIATSALLIFLTSARPLDRLTDGNLVVLLNRNGMEIRGADATARRMIQEKLSPQGEPFIAAAPITRSSGNDGGDATTIITIRRPFPNERLLDPRVEIRWNPATRSGRLGGDKPDGIQIDYQVIIRQQDNLQAPALRKNVSEPTAIIPLNPGTAYLLEVNAIGTNLQSHEYAFEVLSRNRAMEIERSVERFERSHLLRGIFYEKEQIYSRALTEYRSLQQSNPRSQMARKIYDALLHKLGDKG